MNGFTLQACIRDTAMPGGVVVAQGTLNPLTQVRILAGQPSWHFVELLLVVERLLKHSTNT